MALSALDSALLGPLFTTPRMAEVFADRAWIRAMLHVEAALAAAEARFGLVPDGLASAIAAVDPDAFDPAALGAATSGQGVPVIPFVKALQRLLPPDMEPHVHKGATSQDIHDTATALLARDGLAVLARGLRDAIDELAALAGAHKAALQIGRTYGQHAVPITFGYTAAVWLAGLLEQAERLPEIRRRIGTVSLGGPAGTLHGLGADGPLVVEAFGAELGLGVDAISWHTRRSRMVDLGCWLAVLIGVRAKMADDIVRLAATDCGELCESAAGGSSAMPHKRNPVRSAAILAAASHAKGLAAGLFDSLVASHQRPAGGWQAEWLAIPPLFGLAAGALEPVPIDVDAERMAANVQATGGLVFSERLAAALAPALGRAAAHARAEAAAADAIRTRRPLRDVLAADAALPLGTAAFDALFDTAPYIAAAAPWIDRVLADVPRVRKLLED